MKQSLVVIWKQEDFAAVACDGLALEKARRGKKFVRATENVSKFWMISHNLVLASVGKHWTGETLAADFTRMADERPADQTSAKVAHCARVSDHAR